MNHKMELLAAYVPEIAMTIVALTIILVLAFN